MIIRAHIPPQFQSSISKFAFEDHEFSLLSFSCNLQTVFLFPSAYPEHTFPLQQHTSAAAAVLSSFQSLVAGFLF